MMNTQTPMPGYVVEALFWEQSGKISSKSFIDANLLTARHAAHHYAQTLVAQKGPSDVLDIEIYLTEFDPQQVVLSSITQVFSQRFHRSQHIPEKDAYTELVTFDLTEVSGDCKPIDLTVDLTREDSAYSSLQAVWDSLEGVAYELEYFHLHGHNTGFGCVRLDEIGAYPLLPEAEELVALPDQQLRQRLLKLQESQALPYRSYTVLYDSYTYASSIIHNYNHQAIDDEKLSVHVEFLGNLQVMPTTDLD